MVCPECNAVIKQCPEPSCATWNRAESRFCRSCRGILPSAAEVASTIGIGGIASGGQIQPTSVRDTFRRIPAGLIPRGVEEIRSWVAGGRVCWHFEGKPEFQALNPYVVGPQPHEPFPIHPLWSGGLNFPPLLLGHYLVFAATDRVAFWETANIGRTENLNQLNTEIYALENVRLVHPPVRVDEDAIALLLEQGEKLLLRIVRPSPGNGHSTSFSSREIRLDSLKNGAGAPLLSHPLGQNPHQFFVISDKSVALVDFSVPKTSKNEWKLQVEDVGGIGSAASLHMAPPLYSFDHSLFVRAFSTGAGADKIPRIYQLRHWSQQARWQVHELPGTEDPSHMIPLNVRGIPFLAVLKSEKVQVHNAREPGTATSDEWGGLQLQAKEMAASGSMLLIRQRSARDGKPGAFRTIQVLDSAGRTRTDQSDLISNLSSGALFDGIGVGGLVREEANLYVIWKNLIG